MIAHQLVPLFALGLNVLLIVSALASDRRRALNRSFAYFAGAQAVWNLGSFGLRGSGEPHQALMWEVILHVGVIPIPILFYRYVVVFLNLPTRRRSLLIGYTLCAFFLVVSPTPLFMRGVQQTYWGWAPLSGPLYAAFFLYFQTYMVLGLVRLIRARRAQTSSYWRSRILLVMAGVTVSLLGGAIDFLRFILGLERLYPVGIPANSLLALALGLAIVRYRLLDMSALAKRSLLYLSTSIAVLPFLILGDWIVRRVVLAEGPVDSIIAGLILLIGFSLALPLLRFLERGLERVMFARQHSVREALLALSKDMASFLEVGALGRTLTAELVARVPVMRAVLYLYNPRTGMSERSSLAVSPAGEAMPSSEHLDAVFTQWLRRSAQTMVVGELALAGPADPRIHALSKALDTERVALLVPTFLDGELAAVLVLGEKLSGEIFSPDEIRILEMLMGQTAIALKNARLYQDLKDRMLELQTTQQQLLQSAKLAAIGELAASVAHEINNPLTVILGSSAVLLRTTPSEAAAYAKITNIINAANRAGKIVHDLLDFSRRREPQHESVNVNDLVRRSLDIVQARVASGAVGVRLVLDEHLPPVMGDPDELTQVFINLFANAVDAMPGGGILTVETSTLYADGAVSIRVADTGMGMDQTQIARIFEPFFTTKEEGKGTGLGLSVSLSIISKHGGSIEVDSHPGQGTTMRVKLPERRETSATVPVGAGAKPALEQS
ncbi:MAG: ATP-binding protein [Candidatus Rokuibacteriota bacterium]